MKKNPKTQKRVFKKKFAKIMACAIAGIGTAGLLSGCSEGVSPVWGTGTDVPETGVIGEMFYDTDDNKLYQYDGEKWEFITELKGDDGGIGPNGFDGASVEVRFVEAENKYEWRYTAGTDEDKSWKDLVDLDDLEGEDAKNIRIKKGETHIVWGYGETDDDVTAWNNLVDLELLKVKGDDGKSAQLQVVGNKLQVNNNDGEGWKDVFDLNTLKGQDGRGIEINFDDETNVYEWRYTSGTDTAWKTLVDLDELVGVAGESVELQVEDDYIQWKQTNGEWQNLIAVADLKVKGDTGATGATIQSVRTNKLDKWGIRSELVLVLNDENETEVKSSELVEVIDNLFYTATSDAEIRQLMAYGVEHIKLGADVEIDAQTNGAFIPEHDVEFDLNGYTFSYPVEVSSERMVIEKGVVVEFRDGNMDFGAAAPNSGSIIINTKSTIVLDNVNYHSDGTALFPRGDTALVRVTNSVVVGQNYGIATNASLDPVTKLPIYAGIEVIVDDSEIRAEAEDYDGTALLFNVPGTLFVNDSEIVADRHAAVIRGGDAKLVDTKLVCTGDYEEVEEIETWGTGNAVPSAVLVVGNEGNGYKWPTSLELDGVKTVAKRFKTPELIVASNEEEEFATNLVLVNHNFTRRQLETAEFSENAKITIILDSIQPVFDIVDMYGYYAVMGDSMQFVLSNDVMIDEEYLTMDELKAIGYLFETIDMSDYHIEMTERVKGIYVQSQEEFDEAMMFAGDMGGEISIKLGCDVYYYLTDPGMEMMFELIDIVENGYNFELIDAVAASEPMEFAEAILDTENTKPAIILWNDINFADLLGGVQPYSETNPYATIEIDRDMIIDLQGHKLSTVAEFAGRINVVNGATVTIKNGELDLASINPANWEASIGVYAGSTLNVENVTVTAEVTAFIVYGDATALRITDGSYVTAGTYAIGTNSGTEENYGVEITIKDSELNTASYDEGSDNTAMFVVVPSQVLVMNSRLVGDRQALIVRGGQTILMNSVLQVTGAFENKDAYTGDNAQWKNGNEVPTAALVVGDRQAGYKEFDAYVMAMNTQISAPADVKDIYAYNDAIEKEVVVGVMFDNYNGDASKVVLGDAVYAELGDLAPITTLNGFACFDLQEAIDKTVPEVGMEEYGINIYLNPGDFELPTAVTVNKKVNLYLNNTNISIPEDTAGDGVFHVVEGGDLTINGFGTIDGCGDNKWNIVVFVEGGNLTINGGTYTNENLTVDPEDNDADHFDVIYVKGGNVTINDGVFKGYTPAWLLNIRDDRRNDSSIVVNGGFFYGFNPADNATEGKGTNYVADGVEVRERESGWWAVGASVNQPIPGQNNGGYPGGDYEGGEPGVMPGQPEYSEEGNVHYAASYDELMEHFNGIYNGSEGYAVNDKIQLVNNIVCSTSDREDIEWAIDEKIIDLAGYEITFQD